MPVVGEAVAWAEVIMVEVVNIAKFREHAGGGTHRVFWVWKCQIGKD